MALEPLPADMSEPPPRMFARPTEAADPLAPIRASEPVTRLHDEWARMHGRSPAESISVRAQIRGKLRSGLQRLLGRADHEFLGDLVRAVDALAARCDELSVHLSNQEIVSGNLAEILGEDVTRLRAAVDRLNGSGRDTASPGSDG
jgi:hypothetical protein